MIVLEGFSVGYLCVVDFLLVSGNLDSGNLVIEDAMLKHRQMGHSAIYPAPSTCKGCLQGKQHLQPYF